MGMMSYVPKAKIQDQSLTISEHVPTSYAAFGGHAVVIGMKIIQLLSISSKP